MRLNIPKLENVRKRGGKVIARCPACAEVGHDQKGEHLVVNADGRFGCVLYSGDSVDAKEHRKRIFALCGDREIKPLAVRSAGLGRLGRVSQSQSAEPPLKTGLLGRLGRLFETHLKRERESTGGKERNAERQVDDCGKGVLAVLNESKATPHRPLSERERALLVRWCGTDNHPIILQARNLFNATIVAIERSAGSPERMAVSLQADRARANVYEPTITAAAAASRRSKTYAAKGSKTLCQPGATTACK